MLLNKNLLSDLKLSKDGELHQLRLILKIFSTLSKDLIIVFEDVDEFIAISQIDLDGL